MIWSILATILVAALVTGIVAYLDAHVRAFSEFHFPDASKPTITPSTASRMDLWLERLPRR